METIYHRLVGHFGTQDETATRLGVDQSTVSGWVRDKHKISAAVAIRAERETRGAITRYDLRPDIFGESEEGAA